MDFTLYHEKVALQEKVFLLNYKQLESPCVGFVYLLGFVVVFSCVCVFDKVCSKKVNFLHDCYQFFPYQKAESGAPRETIETDLRDISK